MAYPSVKRLTSGLGIPADNALRIREWMRYADGLCAYEAQTACGGYRVAHAKPEDVSPQVADWIRSCYGRPTRREVAHAMIAQILTEGLEADFGVFDPQENWPSFERGPRWEAVNMGDAYTPTIIYRRGRYSVGCWGDLPEASN